MIKQSKKLGISHIIDAERDLAFKPDMDANSFFVIADVETANGRQFNILIHQLQVPAPADAPLKFLSIFNVFDPENGVFKSDEIMHDAGEVTCETGIMYNKMPNSMITGDLHSIEASADFDWGSVSLKMEFPDQIIYNAGNGVFNFVGNVPTGEYSIVNGLGSGTLTFNGETHKVSGKTWFDRQWFWRQDFYGNKARPMEGSFQEQDMYWTWMNLTLDNGEVLSLWDLYLYGTQSSWVTLVHADGSHIVANIEPLARAAGDFWTSESGQRYPTSWVVNIAELDAALIVKAIKKEQEVPSEILPKYEGLADISGTYKGKAVTGYTLVEMVGNWNKDRTI